MTKKRQTPMDAPPEKRKTAGVSEAKAKSSGKKWLKRLSPARKKLLFLGIGMILSASLIFLYLWMAGPQTPPEQPNSRAKTPLSSIFYAPASPETAPRTSTSESAGRSFIQAIRLTPSQPTRLDTLKVTIIPADPDKNLSYGYRWKVNDQVLEGAAESFLNLSGFKKRDLVTVTVTPYDGERAGFPVESPVTVLYGVAPTLELEAAREARQQGKAVELQLISRHPDSDTVTFGLAQPTVSGMSIDSRTGRIAWSIQPGQKGNIRFGAYVEDTDGTKVTKIFDVTID